MSNHTYIPASESKLKVDFKTYCRTLQAELSINVKACEKASSDFKKDKIIDFDSRKEMVSRKMEALMKKHDDVLNSIPGGKDGASLDNLEKYENEAESVSKQIESILGEKNSDEKQNFEKVADLEERLNELNKGVASFRAHYEVAKKIDAIYASLEKQLDDIAKEEFSWSKTLDLSTVTSEMLKKDR